VYADGEMTALRARSWRRSRRRPRASPRSACSTPWGAQRTPLGCFRAWPPIRTFPFGPWSTA